MSLQSPLTAGGAGGGIHRENGRRERGSIDKKNSKREEKGLTTWGKKKVTEHKNKGWPEVGRKRQ